MSKPAALVVTVTLVALAVAVARAQNAPDAHIMLQEPQELGAAEAEALYAGLKDRMAALYAIADHAPARSYQRWRRYNTGPYLSATHGNRYVNNYANGLADAYGALPAGGRYPAGSVFAKDSVSVMSDGTYYPGALFLMEKLAAGTSPETADWRYVMILPDGSIFGDSRGDNAEKVAYCHTCHELVAKDDYLFFVPEDYVAE